MDFASHDGRKACKSKSTGVHQIAPLVKLVVSSTFEFVLQLMANDWNLLLFNLHIITQSLKLLGDTTLKVRGLLNQVNLRLLDT